MRRRQDITSWLARWGFAVLTGISVVVAVAAGTTVAIPADIPGVALRAPSVYRMEVSGAVFAGLYVAALAFVLALRNHAFTEIGTSGVRARSLSELPTTLRTHERALNGLLEALDEIWDLRDDPEEG